MSSRLKIGIVGLGLIGASIEKNLQAKGYEILAVSKSQNRSNEIKDLVSCDIVFLCGPQFEILKNLDEIALITAKSSGAGTVPENDRAFANTIITDAGSTKTMICNKANDLGIKNFIGGHPMAGTEKVGYDASFPELFEGATWMLTEKNEKLESVIKDLGAGNILISDAEAHDKAVSVISHLPLILSVGLGDSLKLHNKAKELMGPAFKDMTRVAKGNENLGRDIIAANRENIKETWSAFKVYVDSLLEVPASHLAEELLTVKDSLEGRESRKEEDLVTS